MNENVMFSQMVLRNVRREAKKAGVVVPKGMTALRSSVGGWWLVEGDAGSFRKEVVADNAYDAKQKVISALLP